MQQPESGTGSVMLLTDRLRAGYFRRYIAFRRWFRAYSKTPKTLAVRIQRLMTSSVEEIRKVGYQLFVFSTSKQEAIQQK